MSLPLTSDQSLRIRVMVFVTHGDTEPCDVSRHFQIEATNVAAYEAQLVSWGLISPQTIYPQPRYTMTDAGWVYIALAHNDGTVLTVPGILAAIPEGTFAGDADSVSAALPVLQGSALVAATTGYTLTTD
jgi:hypothetical protein